MKNVMSKLAATLFVAVAMIGCNEASKKDMSNANENMKQANQDMRQAAISANDTAKANTIANWKSFKNESELMIDGMEKDVDRLEAKMDNAKNSSKAALKSKLEKSKQKIKDLKEKLKQRNAEFESDVDHFDSTTALKTQSFRREFKHDMNEMGTAFKDLFKDNVKDNK